MEMGMVARWKLRWQTWDLRVVILVSLGLQILLIFAAPLRKRVSRAWITMPIWSAYLLADVMANFAVGLISNSQGMKEKGKTMSIQCRNRSGPFADPTLLAFWAPFLLLHLGGPDTITAFSLADNELWLRHLLGLGFQCCAVGYAFIQSYPNHKFWIPTLLIFLAGVIKYSERTRALYLASSRIFQDSLLEDPDPGPNYAKFMDEYTSKNNAKLPTSIQMIPEPSKRNKTGTDEAEEGLSDLEVVQAAHKYYLTFRGLIADLIFSSAQRNESRDYFLKQTARDAFKIVEVELNFFYEILYTKAKVMQDDLQKAKEIFSARGDWILKHEGHINLLDWINKIEFDESLILWHIATELCYYTDHSKDEKNSGNSYDDNTKLNRELSKVLSDYMLYLLIMQSPMLSSIAGIGKMRYRDTCAEAKKFFRGRKILKEDVNFHKIFSSSKCFSCYFSKYCFNEEKGQDKKLQEACKSILKVNTEVSPVTVKGDRSKSVLFDACRLAKELQKLKWKQLWKIISKVWVELMSYAAGHCRVNAHMAQLSKGGQLLTLVWLLMAHLGLGDQFQIHEGHARAKLIVSK